MTYKPKVIFLDLEDCAASQMAEAYRFARGIAASQGRPEAYNWEGTVGHRGPNGADGTETNDVDCRDEETSCDTPDPAGRAESGRREAAGRGARRERRPSQAAGM